MQTFQQVMAEVEAGSNFFVLRHSYEDREFVVAQYIPEYFMRGGGLELRREVFRLWSKASLELLAMQLEYAETLLLKIYGG